MSQGVLLSVEEMYRADAAAVEWGVPSINLMEAAGTGVADEIKRRWTPRPVAILCGPGNNGGDGFVVARLLAREGWAVRLALLGARDKLSGDALINAERWDGEVLPMKPSVLDGCELVVDALFGAGLARELGGAPLEMVRTINERGLDCLGVDIPSGVHGDTGQMLGDAPKCEATVTFFRPKPGHLLLPGRALCGELVVVDIGIPEGVLEDIAPLTCVNGPEMWLDCFPWPRAEDNKFNRGHAVIAGGDEMTGAARLAARGARRAGAGLATITTPPEAFAIYALDAPGTLVKPIEFDNQFHKYIEDPRRNAVLVGPGNGVNDATRYRAITALEEGVACVLDADALTVFQDAPDDLFARVKDQPCVLTPHEGEFKRLFPDLEGSRLERARAAAETSGAVVLFKGSDTVVAAPDGRAAINADAPPELATAGSGDVLAGVIVGLLAQGMDGFEAAAAGAWLHAMAGAAFGPGLIAEDIPDALPAVLRSLKG